MSTFVVTYSIVWLALVLYVARLGHHQRHLIREVSELENVAGEITELACLPPRDRHRSLVPVEPPSET